MPCRIHLDHLPCSNHGRLCPPQGSRWFPIPTRQLCQRRHIYSRSTFNAKGRRHESKIQSGSKVGETPSQGPGQAACSAEFDETEFGVHGMGTFFGGRFSEEDL